ncbi:unknown [Mycoplasma sp. CAG:472]|nr:unknown [Mycoplasma sp. CAG:472]
MIVNAELVEKVSKAGKKYICVELYLTGSVKKTVFLTDAEVELIKLFYSNKTDK